MLNEPASSLNKRPATGVASLSSADQEDNRVRAVRELVEAVLLIEDEIALEDTELTAEDTILLGSNGNRLVAGFKGQLLTDSETAYDALDDMLARRDQLALFRERDGKHFIHVIQGRVSPRKRPWWPNLLLLIATLFSVLLVGTDIALNEIAAVNLFQAQAIAQNGLVEMWRGLPYAISILLILGAHELGHYFAARRHNLAVTLPYFIPLPFISPFGTLGAFIQLRQPIRNRKILMDVGASGPLAGLAFAVPILLIGLANTTPHPISNLGGIYEGDSIVYAAAKIITYGHFIPDGQVDICINCSQLAWAGWTGLLVTALNLFPLGQLDGGHIIFAAFGKRARRLYYPLIGLMVGLTLFVSSTWWLWLILVFFVGQVYAVPLDAITPLDTTRRRIALLAMITFILIFVPAPLTESGSGGVLTGSLVTVAAVPLIRLAVARWQGRNHRRNQLLT